LQPGQLFYKYVPFGVHWRDRLYDTDAPGLTPRQHEMLAYPKQWYTPPLADDPEAAKKWERAAPWGLVVPEAVRGEEGAAARL